MVRHQEDAHYYVEESEIGPLAAEIKRKESIGRFPKSFTQAYPEATTQWVHPGNLLDFIQS